MYGAKILGVRNTEKSTKYSEDIVNFHNLI